MTLATGDRLGSYEVLELIGAGGMGEVHRARDTRLHRDVALKVLPEARRLDTEALQRFEREARLLASLNHPNIATLHGIETAGAVQALALAGARAFEGDSASSTLARVLEREPDWSKLPVGVPRGLRVLLQPVRFARPPSQSPLF